MPSRLLLLKKQRGSLTIVVMMIVAITGVTALCSAMMVHQIQRVNQQARIKSLLSALEANLKLRAHQTYAYLDCDTEIGPSSCQLNLSYFQNILFTPTYSSLCPEGSPPPPCGIVIEDLSFSALPSPLFTATIRYTPLDLSMAPIRVSVEPPFELLQTENTGNRCRNGLFEGYNPNTGAISCRAPMACGPNTVLSVINAQMDSQCDTLPPKHFPDDGSEEVILTDINYFMEQHNLPDLMNRPAAEQQAMISVLNEFRQNHQKRMATSNYRPLYEIDWWRK